MTTFAPKSSGPFSAGRLRHRINIDQKVEVQDPETGLITEQWVPFAQKVAAEVVPVSGKEFIESAAEQSQVIARITIRYRQGVVAKMRATHTKNGQVFYYNIEAVLPDYDSGLEYMSLPCSEGVNDG